MMTSHQFDNLSDKKKFVSYVYLATIFVNIVYVLFKVYQGETGKTWTNTAFALGAAISWVLANRFNRFNISKMTFLTISHALVFFAAWVGPPTASVGVYFIVLILVTHCVLELDEWKTALSFNVIGIFLCILSISYNLELPYQPEYARRFGTLNLILSGVFAMMVFVYQNFLQSRARQQIISNNERIVADSLEIKKANLELDKFVYSVSHDIRAPLTSITGLVNLSKFAQSEKELREIINRVGNSARSLLKTTNDIVDYSRANRLEIVLKNVQLRKLLNEIQWDLNLAYPDNGVFFSCDFDDEFSFIVDYSRLKIILTALYSNSIKYRDKLKSSSFIRIEARKTVEFVTLTFADNGIGILPDRLTSIFNMFYRATDDAQGSGLGLYILKHSIEKLGGAVCVASEPGEGTIFKIVLPIIPAMNNRKSLSTS